ncbi:hypothetical protein P1X14_01365 [Sphingomonas sp. AOB5]|uniref:hypothetical protein n=1 Tax=Sphingomonas sp. AOB5 TaxID=3034017 RepID=UPI0023F95061|nr:hypothetical protein [Sphingomonas sp. AOB5]MDF7773880.1 hypothetical protein [Sphingomonas sp. AOB5]
MKTLVSFMGHFAGQLLAVPLVVLAFVLLSEMSYGAILAMAVAYVLLLGFFGMRVLRRKAKPSVTNEIVNG